MAHTKYRSFNLHIIQRPIMDHSNQSCLDATRIAEQLLNTEGNKNVSQYFKWNISKDIYNNNSVTF